MSTFILFSIGNTTTEIIKFRKSVISNSTIIAAITTALNTTIVSIQTNATRPQRFNLITPMPSGEPSVSPTSATPSSPLIYNNITQNKTINLYLSFLLILLIPLFLICCCCYQQESITGFKKFRCKEKNKDLDNIEFSDERLLQLGLVDDDKLFTTGMSYAYASIKCTYAHEFMFKCLHMYIYKYIYIYIYISLCISLCMYIFMYMCMKAHYN
jgi:hypothetical protein